MNRLSLSIAAVSASAILFAANSKAAPASPESTITVSLPTAEFNPAVPINTVIIQPVATTNIDPSLGYVSFYGDFAFDSSVVTFSSPLVEGAGLTATGWSVSGGILPGAGPIRIFRLSVNVNDGETPLTGSGTLCNLRMRRVSSSPGATSPLIWQAPPNSFVFKDPDGNTHVPGQNNGLITISEPMATPPPGPTGTPTATPTPTPTAAPAPTPPPGLPYVSLPVADFNPTVPIDTVIIQPVITTNIEPSLGYVSFYGDFAFDSSVVTFSSPLVEGAGLTATGWSVSGSILQGAGPIRIFRLSVNVNDGETPLNGSGTLFNLRMRRVSSSPGATSPLIWQAPPNSFVFKDPDGNTHVPGQNNGIITITMPAATPTPSPSPAPIPTPTPAPTPLPMMNISGALSYYAILNPDPVRNVMLTVTGASGSWTLSDGTGNYQFSSLTGGGSYTVTPTKAALTPGSEGIDAVDILVVLRHFLELTPIPAGAQLDAADVDTTAAGIDGSDILAIQRFYLGFPNSLNSRAGQYQFAPANRSYSPLVSNQTGQNYDALIFGDVISPFADRPSQNAAGDGTRARQVPFAVAAVTLPEAVADQTNFIAAARTSAIDSKNKLVGFQGDFTFDERVVTFQSPPVQKAGITGGNWTVAGNVLPRPGPIRTLRMVAYSNDFTPLSGSGTLFELRMTKANKAAQSTQLIWAAPPGNLIFIDADLNLQKPSYAASGGITSSGPRK